MNHLDEYGCLFREAITVDQDLELGQFTVDALCKVAAQDTESLVQEIEKLAGEITDPDIFCVLLDALDHAGDTIAKGVMEKVAMVKLGGDKHKWTPADKMNLGFGIAGLVGAALPFVSSMLAKKKAANAANMTFNHVIGTNAHLRSDPMMPQYFDTIKKFSPKVATDPILLSNALNHLQAMGPAGLTVAAAKEMAELSYGKNVQAPLGPNTAQAFGQAVTHAQGIANTVNNVNARVDPQAVLEQAMLEQNQLAQQWNNLTPDIQEQLKKNHQAAKNMRQYSTLPPEK